jgi:hypothetical protein
MPSEGQAGHRKQELTEPAQLRRTASVLINEVKHWVNYETKSIDLYRKLSAGADGRRANAIQSQKSPAEDDDIFRIPGPERCPACRAAAHIFARALSPAAVFKRAVPPADAWGDAAATTNEQFISEPACDYEQFGLATNALGGQQSLGRLQVQGTITHERFLLEQI